MAKNSLARDVLKADIGDPSEGLLFPVVTNWFMENGKYSQYTDREGMRILLDILNKKNKDDYEGRTTFSGGKSANCMREQILNITLGAKKTNEPDYKLLNIFDDGFWRNLRWIMVFHRMGILIEYEKTSFSKKLNFSWTPDCRVNLSEYYGEEYKDVPVEIKGMHEYEFNQFRNRTGRANFAASRTMQVHAYMLAEDASHWLVWAENKNNQDFDECWMPRDPDIIKYLKSRNKYMQKAISVKALPAIECEMNDADPKYAKCSRSSDCKAALKVDHPTLGGMKNRLLMGKKAAKAFV